MDIPCQYWQLICALQVTLEDSLVTMSTILSSRFIGGIRAEVERVQRQLNTFNDTLDQWIQVRKQRGYNG